MGRDTTLAAVHTREMTYIASSGALTLPTGAVTAGKYLHTNIITFSDVFPEKSDSYVKLYQLRITENITADSLAKVGFKLYIFDNSAISCTALNAFNFGDDSSGITTIESIKAIIPVLTTDYTTVTSNSNNYDAVAVINLDNPILVKNAEGYQYLKAVAITTGTETIAASATIKLELGVIMQ